MHSLVRFFIAGILFVACGNTFAEEMPRVSAQSNHKARVALYKLPVVHQQMMAIERYGQRMNMKPVLAGIESTENEGFPPNSKLTRENAVAEIHKFIYLTQNQNVLCTFSIYAIWLNSQPMSIHPRYTAVSSPAVCQ